MNLIKNFLKIIIILLIFVSISTSALKDLGNDIYNIISDARIGFGMGYEYVNSGLEFLHREDVNFNELNLYSLQTYYGFYNSYEKYTYYISARPVSRLSLKWSYEETKPYVIWSAEDSLLKLYNKKVSQLDLEYFISPRWSLYGIIANQVEDNSLNSFLSEPATLIEKENKLYALSKMNANSITVGSKITLDWGQFNIYDTITDVYSYLPKLQGLPGDFINLSYSNLGDNFVKKENDFNIAYYLNPAVKLDISGLFQNKITISNKVDDTLSTVIYTFYPIEVKYRLTEIWELGVKVSNEHYNFTSEVKSKTFSNEIERYSIKKDNYDTNYNYLLLSLSRYFKYQGLNLYGRFKRYTRDTIYEYQENILYSEEKSILWSRWDESVRGYSVELGFYYRPIMEKLYVSAGIVYNYPTTYRKPTPAEYTTSLYDYSLSAFYKPTTLFEIKVEKGYRNMIDDYKVPSNIPIQLKQSDIWNIEKNSFSQLEEREKVAITLRTLKFTLEGSIENSSIGKIYYKRDDILSLDRFAQPKSYLDVYKRFITYNLGYSYTTQALFSQSQFVLSGGIYYRPNYSYDDGTGNNVNVSEISYLVTVRYEFTPTFYIEGGVEASHYFEGKRSLGLEETNSILSKEEFHSYRQSYKINLVYRP